MSSLIRVSKARKPFVLVSFMLLRHDHGCNANIANFQFNELPRWELPSAMVATALTRQLATMDYNS
jgi:hypothetical protein